MSAVATRDAAARTAPLLAPLRGALRAFVRSAACRSVRSLRGALDGGRTRGRAGSVFSGDVKVAALETLFCDAGWRPWIFLKATADDGLVGWAEITDSHGSPRGLAGIVEDLSPLVVGRDPRPVEAIYWDLYRATRQSPGSVVAKALAGIENALLDLKAKALGVPVYELFGGPTREAIPMYWSHCGTTRARAYEVTGTPKLASYEDVAALGGGRSSRATAPSRNVVVPGEDPKVLMPGFNEGGHAASGRYSPTRSCGCSGFAAGTGGGARPIMDLNFNLEPKGAFRVAKALEPFDLLWLEVDLFDPGALADLRHVAPMPVCSGENLYSSRDFRPYRKQGGMDVASVDVIWNGFHQAKKIADLAETFEVNCAPHNYYSHLATFIYGAVVRGDSERTYPRVRRRRRPLARRARYRATGDLVGRAAHPHSPGLGGRAERGRARLASMAERVKCAASRVSLESGSRDGVVVREEPAQETQSLQGFLDAVLETEDAVSLQVRDVPRSHRIERRRTRSRQSPGKRPRVKCWCRRTSVIWTKRVGL